MAKTYVVTGPLATPYREDGTRVYLYQGTQFPEDLREGELERFLDLGLVGESGAEAAKPAPRQSAAKPVEK